jgi:FixJ family two-component response regulator
VDFLMKPFTAEALTVAVSRLLQHDYSDTDIRAAVAEAKSFRKTAGS